MIVYHSNQEAAFTGNHIYYFQFQPLFLQVITVTSVTVPSAGGMLAGILGNGYIQG